MFRNYLIVALRNLNRQKAFSIINILGLAIGLATCLLIVSYIQDELGVDRWHTHGDRIYRIMRETKAGGQSETIPFVSGAIGPALNEEMPEVEKAVRLWGWGTEAYVEDKKFELESYTVDPEMFELFDFPFVKGNVESAFPNPASVAITESTAKQLYGDEDPIGKTFRAVSNHKGGIRTVTAILKDPPVNSTLRFDYISTPFFSSDEAHLVWNQWIPTGGYRPVNVYFLLREGANIESVKSKLPAFMERHMGAEIARTNAYHVQKFDRIYLYSWQDFQLDWYANIDQIYQFGAIAALVLAIGCINFANLTTARSARRAHEVGLRKVTGAYRSQLMGQFLGESIITALIALMLAIIAVKLALPEFNTFFSKQIEFNLLSDPLLVLSLLGITTFVGILAGFYPAVFLSSFQPTETLKGTFQAGSRGQWVRKGLLIAQFVISIALIIGTGAIYKQMDFIKNARLGYDMSQIVMIPIFATDNESKTLDEIRLADRYVTIKQAFLDHPNALEATAYRWPLGWWGGLTRTMRAEGHENTDWRMSLLEIDEDFIDVFRIEITQGRKFDPIAFPTDTSAAFIVNQTAVAKFGWDDPIGKTLEWVDRTRNRKGTVIGVAKDFHTTPLREKVGPVALTLRSPQFYTLGVRIKPDNFEETLAHFKKTWAEFVPPDQQFDYMMWDQQFEMMYELERRAQALTMLSSGMAILLACMGLFGLAAFNVEQRVKEIGVRKVLGASVSNLVIHIAKTFAILVLIANLFAWPIAYYAIRNWLDGFAYQTNLSVWLFLLSGFIALAIALLTVGYHALRAALANPVESLRHE